MKTIQVEMIDELKKQIKRLEDAYGAIDDARHDIRMAFADSHDTDKQLSERDFREPLKKILECPRKGLDNLIKIMETELSHIENNIENDLDTEKQNWEEKQVFHYGQ
tara:strand:+ start:632 stop:952 length:321 start_codon:yes stop_codon:yes gene_type:complete